MSAAIAEFTANDPGSLPTTGLFAGAGTAGTTAAVATGAGLLTGTGGTYELTSFGAGSTGAVVTRVVVAGVELIPADRPGSTGGFTVIDRLAIGAGIGVSVSATRP